MEKVSDTYAPPRQYFECEQVMITDYSSRILGVPPLSSRFAISCIKYRGTFFDISFKYTTLKFVLLYKVYIRKGKSIQ